MRGSRVRRTAVGALAVVGLALAAVGCTDGSDTPAPKPPASSTPTPPSHLTFGVYGPAGQTAAFRSTVDDWNATTDGPQVRLHAWATHEAFRNAVEAGTDLPDVFLTSRSDLQWLLDNHLTQPVDELLDERGVNFGDGYARDALQAFSANDRLQCMPYGTSAMVVYYNKDLVNFARMQRRGLDAPEPDATGWSFDQFAAAAQFASRPARGTKGVHVAPTLSNLSPFILSGGGSVFDDETNPTTLTLSSDASRAALQRTLQLLRDPKVTLDEQQRDRATPLRWFERGKLGMITGYRSLVPELRQFPGLEFDVIAMPALEHSATVGDISGLCLSRKAASTPAAADFMVHELSVPSVSMVTSTGYLAPSNLEVALSDTFLQPGRQPEHAAVFNSSVRFMQEAPLVDGLNDLQAAVRPELEELMYGPGSINLDGITQQIDDTSKPILSPPTESASPSDTPAE